MQRPLEVEQVISTIESYNPEHIGLLEKHLSQQSRDATYHDLDANLCLLKLYLFHPHEAKLELVATVLTKAMMYDVDGSSFIQALFLLDQEMAAEEPIAKLIELATLLHQCQFEPFWQMWQHEELCQDMTAGVVGFEQAVRTSIGRAVEMTFQSIHLDRLMKYMGWSQEVALMSAWLEERGWCIDPAQPNMVKININSFNEAKSITLTEQIRFEQLGRLLPF